MSTETVAPHEAPEPAAKVPPPLNDWALSRAQVDNLHRNELNERTTDNLGSFS